MTRTIRTIGLHDECIEEGRCLYRRSVAGAIKDPEEKVRIKRVGGFWNCQVFSFDGAEPKLKWCFGVPGLSKERIESDGFSGPVMRESAAGQRMFYLDGLEWRFDSQQQELYFEVLDAKAELRVTLLAFNFYSACRGD